MPDIEQAVTASIRKREPGDYLWVVMPNPVHLLLTPKMDPSILQDDHLLRSRIQFERIEKYIIQNRSEQHWPNPRKSTPGGLKPAAG